jgi:hypothetical protein
MFELDCLLSFFHLELLLGHCVHFPLLLHRTREPNKRSVQVIQHTHALLIELISRISFPNHLALVLRFEFHQNFRWVLKRSFIMHYQVSAVELLNNIIPFLEGLHSFQPKMVLKLRLRQTLSIVTP